MNFLKKTIKFILFGLILFILSVFYRFFGDHAPKSDKLSLLGTDEASADVPSSCSSSSSSGSGSSSMCDSGGGGK